MTFYKFSILLCVVLINLSNCFDDQKFANGLYKQMSKVKSQNLIFSPMSIQTALSLAMFGATGETKQEMKTAMHYENSNDGEIQEKYNTLSATVKASNDLKIANKIYVAQGYSIKQKFNEIAVKSFNSEAQNIDFSKRQEAAGKINKWVEDQTNDKIHNLIAPKSLDANTKMVLVNAVYYKGAWKHRFFTATNLKEQFFLNNENSVEVDMMTNEASSEGFLVLVFNVFVLETIYVW